MRYNLCLIFVSDFHSSALKTLNEHHSLPNISIIKLWLPRYKLLVLQIRVVVKRIIKCTRRVRRPSIIISFFVKILSFDYHPNIASIELEIRFVLFPPLTALYRPEGVKCNNIQDSQFLVMF